MAVTCQVAVILGMTEQSMSSQREKMKATQRLIGSAGNKTRLSPKYQRQWDDRGDFQDATQEG